MRESSQTFFRAEEEETIVKVENEEVKIRKSDFKVTWHVSIYFRPLSS